MSSSYNGDQKGEEAHLLPANFVLCALYSFPIAYNCALLMKIERQGDFWPSMALFFGVSYFFLFFRLFQFSIMSISISQRDITAMVFSETSNAISNGLFVSLMTIVCYHGYIVNMRLTEEKYKL